MDFTDEKNARFNGFLTEYRNKVGGISKLLLAALTLPYLSVLLLLLLGKIILELSEKRNFFLKFHLFCVFIRQNLYKMGEVSVETAAYAKIILHAAKYPHCAVNGVLLADGTKIRDGAKNQDLDIVDTVPLFHHSHYLSPMAEIALTQIETVAQSDNRIIAGYYAACENFRDNTVEKCPGQKIADKIAEHFPSAVFIVVDNKRMMQHLDTAAIKLHKYKDGKWKPKDANKVIFQSPYVLDTVSHLLQRGVQKDLVDFDNYLDDLTQDWTNLGIEKLIASINASNTIDDKEKDYR